MAKTTRIEALDLLRLFAFAMVLAYHYMFIGPLQDLWPSKFFVSAFYFGDFGVDLFFIISGFVITLSSKDRTAFQFLKARFNRIVPTFLVCTIILFAFSCTLPLVDPLERINSLIYSLTFFPNLFGKEYFSAVFWTLTVEITFYAWVFVLIAAGVWSKYRDFACLAWAVISIANNNLIHSSMLSQLLITDYSGHFIGGMVLYQIRSGMFKPSYAFLLTLSASLIFARMQGFTSWISGLYGHSLSDSALLFTVFFLLSLVWWASQAESTLFKSEKVKIWGNMSYPLYLLHADIGFWSHAIFERSLFWKYPITKDIFSYPVIMLLAVALSWAIAAFVVNVTDPYCHVLLKKLWTKCDQFSSRVTSRFSNAGVIAPGGK